jgi:hypothetical protein
MLLSVGEELTVMYNKAYAEGKYFISFFYFHILSSTVVACGVLAWNGLSS